MSWDISWHFTRGERIVSSWMHWEKHTELTFHSKGDLHFIKGKVHIWMPMPIPRCRCRVFQMALLKAKNLFHWNVSWNLTKTVYLEFNVKIHCEINVKLVLHETLKENFQCILPFKNFFWNFVFKFVFRRSFLQKQQKKTFIENHTKIWEIVILQKIISKKNFL